MTPQGQRWTIGVCPECGSVCAGGGPDFTVLRSCRLHSTEEWGPLDRKVQRTRVLVGPAPEAAELEALQGEVKRLREAIKAADRKADRFACEVSAAVSHLSHLTGSEGGHIDDLRDDLHRFNHERASGRDEVSNEGEAHGN